MSPTEIKKDQTALLEWYSRSKRELPWRMNRDPYRIWISEIMLQQTTVAAVVPFYERFMKRFPNVKSLAESPLGDVLENWAGLGYYSRARNLHRSAQTLVKSGFPKTAELLEELPGFGAYTARAVSSQAFGERVGVLDGNVIRVLSRRHGIRSEWWKTPNRNGLQAISDRLAQVDSPSDLNQAMMELGATVCTPANPACMLCPWTKSCIARKEGQVSAIPLKRPRREREIWIWEPVVDIKKKSVLLVENDYAPFLQGHWILPGKVQRAKVAPKKFSFRGSVTHHDIFVSMKKSAALAKKTGRRVSIENLKKEIPASLIRKAIEAALKNKQD